MQYMYCACTSTVHEQCTIVHVLHNAHALLTALEQEFFLPYSIYTFIQPRVWFFLAKIVSLILYNIKN